MNKHLFSYVFIASALLLAGAGCTQQQAANTQTPNPQEVTTVQPQASTSTPLVGGDRDEHGCIGSAGYSWCETKAKCLRSWEEECPSSTLPIVDNSSTTNKTVILVSNEDTTKFCDGANMDSAGYAKTITIQKSILLQLADTSSATLAKAVAVQATSGQCQRALSQLDFKVTDGTVSIPPLDGWAGVSIALCSCKPQVEVNLLRLPGIKKVVWDNN